MAMRQFDRHVSDHILDRRLGNADRRVAGDIANRAERRQRDNPAVIRHNRRAELDAVQKRAGVGVHREVPRFVVDIDHRRKQPERGVGDQNVELAEPFLDALEDRRYLIVIPHIGAVRVALDAVALDLLDRFVGRLAAAEVVDDDVGALLGQLLGDRQPDTAGPARTQTRLCP